MNHYEIRIMENGHTRLLIEVTRPDDGAAVRAGVKFAAGKHFEVWRGLDCVYGSLSAARERLSRIA
jgi:hypothetical protein